MPALDAQGVVPALRAGAWLAGVVVPPEEGVPRALEWLRARWGDGDEHLPFTLVHDLGHLLLDGGAARLGSARHLPLWPAEERASRLAYEDRLLSQWVLDGGLQAAHGAIAGMAPEWRDAAIAHAIGLALSKPLSPLVDALATGNAAHLRTRNAELVTHLPSTFEGWTTLEASAAISPAWAEFVLSTLEVCTEALAGRPLFSEADVWEIAHLPDLPSDSARLALRQLHRAAERVGHAGPSVAMYVRRRAREAPVDEVSADDFPAGGFDAISPRGRLENLVRSELGYAGELVELSGGATVDLFDLRFFQSELLYYTRDESPLLDARRRLAFIVDRPGALRHKVAGLPAQSLVMVQGLCMALLADLVRPGMLGPQAVTLDWIWCAADADDAAAVEEERSLMQLSLAADVAHRRVRFSTLDALDEAELPRCPTLVFSPLAGRAHPRRTWVQVGDTRWRVGERRFSVKTPEQLRALADHLLVELIG